MLLITDLDSTLRRTKSGAVTPQSPTDQLVNVNLLGKAKAMLETGQITNWYGASNQAGITTYNAEATGMLKRYDDCVAEMQHLLKLCDPYLSGIAFCPDKAGSSATLIKSPWFLQSYQAAEIFNKEPGSPSFYKPGYGMLLLLARYNGISADECIFVGDMQTDEEAGKAFGCVYYNIDEFLAN